MFSMRAAKEEEKELWFFIDKHLSYEEFYYKIEEICYL